MVILNYFCLFLAISSSVIFGYWRLFHPRLFLAISKNYNIWLLVVILLVLLMVILLMAINSYSIGGYWWLFCYKPLAIIDGYFINGY
jgi:hypothetical protein